MAILVNELGGRAVISKHYLASVDSTQLEMLDAGDTIILGIRNFQRHTTFVSDRTDKEILLEEQPVDSIRNGSGEDTNSDSDS